MLQIIMEKGKSQEVIDLYNRLSPFLTSMSYGSLKSIYVLFKCECFIVNTNDLYFFKILTALFVTRILVSGSKYTPIHFILGS